MDKNEEQLRARWRADLARIAAQIDDLRSRVDAESRTLYASLSAEVTALQSDLERLEAEVDAATVDTHLRQVAERIEELRAKGDAAYQLLQSGMSGQLDPTESEIRRLEAVAANASGDARARIKARIDNLRSAQAATKSDLNVLHWDGGTGDATR